MLLVLFLQAASPSPIPPHAPERMPALLTLVYVGGFSFMVLLLFISLFRNRRRGSVTNLPNDLPVEVKRRLGSTSTNRGLRFLRWLFILLAFGLIGFHVYWAHYAEELNQKFQELSYKDLRNRKTLGIYSARLGAGSKRQAR